MNKFPIDPRILAKAEKILAPAFAEANEMVTDIGRRMMQDQADWLDLVMKDLLPPDLYEAGKRQEKVAEIAAYAKKHGIAVVYIKDTLRIRVMLRGKVHAEFRPQLTVDGEPVNIVPDIPNDPSQN